MRISHRTFVIAGIVGGVLLGSSAAQAQLTFNLLDPDDVKTNSPVAYNGFVQAAARWSSVFADSMTVNLQIGFAPQALDLLGTTTTTKSTYTYTDARKALINDFTSFDDVSAALDLQPAPALKVLMNYTSNNPDGNGSAKPYVDNDM